MKTLFLVISIVFFSFSSFAQYEERDGNRIGITSGISQSALLTSNFGSKPGIGWNGGLSVRGNYYNNWSMIYGMQFFQNNIEIETISASNQKANSKFSLSGAQIRLLLSYNVIKDHVSLDFGPVLQINGELKSDSKSAKNIISGTNLTADQIQDVNTINGNAYIGASAGNKRIRGVIFYQYGFTNILKNLNSQEGIGKYNFKGNMSSISLQLLFNL